jgi:hypothetical protein
MPSTLQAKFVDLRELTESTGVGEMDGETNRGLSTDVLDKYSPDELKIATNAKAF